MANIVLVNRFKSFGWRLAAYIVVAALAWISNNLGLLELPAYITTIVALILGEVTKYLNTKVTPKVQ